MVIEVADTSVAYDRYVKLPLYARAGIPEPWLMVLQKEVIEVHSQPKNGKYQKVQRLKRGKNLVSPTPRVLLQGRRPSRVSTAFLLYAAP